MPSQSDQSGPNPGPRLTGRRFLQASVGVGATFSLGALLPRAEETTRRVRLHRLDTAIRDSRQHRRPRRRSRRLLPRAHQLRGVGCGWPTPGAGAQEQVIPSAGTTPADVNRRLNIWDPLFPRLARKATYEPYLAETAEPNDGRDGLADQAPRGRRDSHRQHADGRRCHLVDPAGRRCRGRQLRQPVRELHGPEHGLDEGRRPDLRDAPRTSRSGTSARSRATPAR